MRYAPKLYYLKNTHNWNYIRKNLPLIWTLGTCGYAMLMRIIWRSCVLNNELTDGMNRKQFNEISEYVFIVFSLNDCK